jgi:hypothetical protein
MRRVPLLFLPILLALLPPAWATTYYAAPTGQSTCSMNQAAPQGGLRAALTCLTPGDTLHVADGTYNNDQIDLARVPNGTSNTARTQITATRGAVLTTSSSGPACLQVHTGRSYITVTGFTCDHANDPRGSGGVDFADNSNGTHDITITGMEIKNFTGDTTYQDNFITLAGVGAAWNVTNVVFDNLYVHDIGLGQTPGCCNNGAYGYGVYLSGTGYTVQNSSFVNVAGFGIHGYCSGDCARDNVIKNNTFVNTGALYGAGPNWQIVNNVLVSVGYGLAAAAPGAQAIGISVGRYGPADAGGDLIANNSIFHSRGACIEVGSTHVGAATIRNNICYKTGNDSITTVSSPQIVESHNAFGVDPRWVNPDGGDLHLQAGSPAIDAGMEVKPSSPDRDGATRPSGTAYDQGAYEYGGTLAPPIQPVPPSGTLVLGPVVTPRIPYGKRGQR